VIGSKLKSFEPLFLKMQSPLPGVIVKVLLFVNGDGDGFHNNMHHINIVIYDCMIIRITTRLGESIVLKNGYPFLHR
jgi:hypothetical protein